MTAAVCRMLVVEDQRDLVENIAEYFESSGYLLDFAYDGLTALHLLATNQYDIVALDLMLPGVSGHDICRRIRHDLRSSVPVIITSAKGLLSDKEAGFLGGANDYLVKPFYLRELELRVESLLGRTAYVQDVFSAGSIRFSPDMGVVSWQGSEVQIGGMPARIFEQLIRAYPKCVTHRNMLAHIWGDEESDANAIRTHIYSLRQAFQRTLGVPLIATVHGRGYRLVLPEGDAA